jgi:hypothetical protein
MRWGRRKAGAVAQKVVPASRQAKFTPTKVKKTLTDEQKEFRGELRRAAIITGVSVAARLAIPVAIKVVMAKDNAQTRKGAKLVAEMMTQKNNDFAGTNGIGSQPMVTLLKGASGRFS